MIDTVILRPTGSPHVVAADVERIEQLGQLATHTATFLYAVGKKHAMTAADPSPHRSEEAEATGMTAPDGTVWTPEVFGVLTTHAWMHLSAAAENLDGFGVLCGAGACLQPPFAVARSAYELAVRSFWLLDPEASLRQRAARAHLDVLASLEHEIEA